MDLLERNNIYGKKVILTMIHDDDYNKVISDYCNNGYKDSKVISDYCNNGYKDSNICNIM